MRRAGPAEGMPRVQIEIKSNVPGTKRNALALPFRNYQSAKHGLFVLEKTYGMPMLFLMKSGKQFFVVSPIALDMARVLKMASALSAAGHNRYAKYGYCSFPVDARPLFFRAGAARKSYLCSRPHLGFLINLFGLKPDDTALSGLKKCGRESLILAMNLLE